MTPIFSEFDQQIMQRALDLAARGLHTTTPNPRVGCVIVDSNGKVIGEGFHRQAGGPHAEVHALNEAGDLAKGATAYVTLEPCSHYGKTPPCSDALIAAGVAHVYFAMEDPNPQVAGRGLERLENAGIDVRGPLLQEQAVALNRGFIKRMRDGLPFVRVKSAMSLDGRTAMANGESKWITGAAARADVQQLRARSCAIVTGVGTVKADDPAMTVRLGEGDRQPLRVIVDSQDRCPKQAKIFQQTGRTIVACSRSLQMGLSFDKEYWYLPEKNGRVSLYHLLLKLADDGCNEVLVEAGPILTGAFVATGLVDEIVVYMAPKLMGSTAKPLFELPLNHMQQSVPLDIKEVVKIGDDWRITAIPMPITIEQQ